MNPSSGKLLTVLLAIVIAMGLYIVLRDSDDGGAPSSQAEPAPLGADSYAGSEAEAGQPVIRIKGGQPVGGPAEYEYAKGDRIRFVVVSDVEEEIHLHGYDVSKEVAAGGRVAFDLAADIEGVFEAELERSAVLIAEITVNP